MTGNGALEQTVIALRVEQPLLIEACHLELVIDIRRQDKVVFILNNLQKIIIHRLRRFFVAVD